MLLPSWESLFLQAKLPGDLLEPSGLRPLDAQGQSEVGLRWWVRHRPEGPLAGLTWAWLWALSSHGPLSGSGTGS